MENEWPKEGPVTLQYRWRLVLCNLATGAQQGILIPPGTKQVTVAIPNNEAPELPVEPKDLYLAVGRSGMKQLEAPAKDEPELESMRCPVCKRAM